LCRANGGTGDTTPKKEKTTTSKPRTPDITAPKVPTPRVTSVAREQEAKKVVDTKSKPDVVAEKPSTKKKGNTDFALKRKTADIQGIVLSGVEVGTITKTVTEEFKDIPGTNLRSAKATKVTKFFVKLDRDQFEDTNPALFNDRVGSRSLQGAKADLADRLRIMAQKDSGGPSPDSGKKTINIDTGKPISREEAGRVMFGTKVTGTTVKNAQKSGIGAKLNQTDADRARIARNKADQDARLARIAARQGTPPARPKVAIPIDTKAQVKPNVERALKAQRAVVGDKVSRIKSVDSKLPAPNSETGKAWGLSAQTLAVCTQTGHIHLNEDLHNREDIIRKSRAAGWFSKAGAEPLDGVIAHEMGHAFLNNQRMTSDQRREVADALVQELGLTNPYGAGRYWMSAQMMDEIVAHPKNRGKIKTSVSKYAATNAAELMAEIWAEYTMSALPRPRLKRVGDVLKKVIAEGAD
jgi:hypothetical protein